MRVEISIYAIKCGHESIEAESAATKDIAAKKIRLIGGMSWESTAIYYQLLNRMVRERQGGLRSVDIAAILRFSRDRSAANRRRLGCADAYDG